MEEIEGPTRAKFLKQTKLCGHRDEQTKRIGVEVATPVHSVTAESMGERAAGRRERRRTQGEIRGGENITKSEGKEIKIDFWNVTGLYNKDIVLGIYKRIRHNWNGRNMDRG